MPSLSEVVNYVSSRLRTGGTANPEVLRRLANIQRFIKTSDLDKVFSGLDLPKVKGRKATPAPPPSSEIEQEYVQIPDLEHSTADLPETGHDKALDDAQQVTAAAIQRYLKNAHDRILAKDKVLARRIRQVAKRVATEFEPDVASDGLLSTADLDETGHDSAVDDNQKPTDLEFWGTEAPLKIQTGPQVSSTPKASKISFAAVKKAHAAVNKAYASGEEVTPKKLMASLLGVLPKAAVIANDKELKTLARKFASIASGRTAAQRKAPSGWQCLKDSWSKLASSASGRRTAGSWSTSCDDYDNVLEVTLAATNREGSLLTPGSVTFTLLSENPTTKVATVEVADSILTQKSGEVQVSAANAKKFVSRWVKRLGDHAANQVKNQEF